MRRMCYQVIARWKCCLSTVFCWFCLRVTLNHQMTLNKCRSVHHHFEFFFHHVKLAKRFILIFVCDFHYFIYFFYIFSSNSRELLVKSRWQTEQIKNYAEKRRISAQKGPKKSTFIIFSTNASGWQQIAMNRDSRLELWEEGFRHFAVLRTCYVTSL